MIVGYKGILIESGYAAAIATAKYENSVLRALTKSGRGNLPVVSKRLRRGACPELLEIASSLRSSQNS